MIFKKGNGKQRSNKLLAQKIVEKHYGAVVNEDNPSRMYLNGKVVNVAAYTKAQCILMTTLNETKLNDLDSGEIFMPVIEMNDGRIVILYINDIKEINIRLGDDNCPKNSISYSNLNMLSNKAMKKILLPDSI